MEECTAALECDGSDGSFKLDQDLRRSRAYERQEKYELAVAGTRLALAVALGAFEVKRS